MPRTMRMEYADAIYHVMNRGDHHKDIFAGDGDRQDCLKPLADAWLRTSAQFGTADTLNGVAHHHQ